MGGPGRGAYAGSPLVWRCAVLSRIWPRERRHIEQHDDWSTVKLTGKWRRRRRGHKGQRNAFVSVQYTCKCGHTGWSSHNDIVRAAISHGITTAADAWPHTAIGKPLR